MRAKWTPNGVRRPGRPPTGSHHPVRPYSPARVAPRPASPRSAPDRPQPGPSCPVDRRAAAHLAAQPRSVALRQPISGSFGIPIRRDRVSDRSTYPPPRRPRTCLSVGARPAVRLPRRPSATGVGTPSPKLFEIGNRGPRGGIDLTGLSLDGPRRCRPSRPSVIYELLALT